MLSPVNRLGSHLGWIRLLINLLLNLHTSHSTPTTAFLQHSYFTHIHTHNITFKFLRNYNISTKPHIFYFTVKIFLHIKFTFKYLTLYKTYQNLFHVVKTFLRVHTSEQWIQRSLLKTFLSNLHQISTFYEDMFDVIVVRKRTRKLYSPMDDTQWYKHTSAFGTKSSSG